MKKAFLPVAAPLAGLILHAFASSAGAASLQEAAQALDAGNVKTVSYSGTGLWFQFGQAPAPGLPWPPFNVSRFAADVDYGGASARVQIVRKQAVEPGRDRPIPVEQRADQYVNGGKAWNLAPAAQPGGAPVASAQFAAVEERVAEIWTTPHGFIKAAVASKACSKPSQGGVEVSFSPDGQHHYVGLINAKNQLVSARTWIDNPVLGDTLVEARFSDYKSFNGVAFPSHIVRVQGGHPVLDLNVADVKVNGDVSLAVPTEVASATPPAVTVTSDKLADGVYYLKGGTHHSVAIEQRDHVVLVEAPLNEERSLAVIAKVKEIIPGKPIKYLVNTHAHFDHSGGLRTLVAEGATIVTHQGNVAYYKQAWAAPHKLVADKLASAPREAKFETFTDKLVLDDGQRKIEIHSLTGSSHNDAFALVYLPAEKIVVEVDAYTPLAANAPAPLSPNPYAVNLYNTITRLKLDVNQIAALHGPGVVGLNDLRAFITPQKLASAQ